MLAFAPHTTSEDDSMSDSLVTDAPVRRSTHDPGRCQVDLPETGAVR